MKKTLGVKFVLGALTAMCVAPSSAADAEAHRDALIIWGQALSFSIVHAENRFT